MRSSTDTGRKIFDGRAVVRVGTSYLSVIIMGQESSVTWVSPTQIIV